MSALLAKIRIYLMPNNVGIKYIFVLLVTLLLVKYPLAKLNIKE